MGVLGRVCEEGEMVVGLKLVFEGDGKMVMGVLACCRSREDGVKEMVGVLTGQCSLFVFIIKRKTFWAVGFVGPWGCWF